MERTGLWRRLSAPQRGTRQHAAATLLPAVPIAAYEAPADPEPLVVPARGDAFSFYLLTQFRWAASGLTVAELERRCATYTIKARSAVLRRVWATARRFDPGDTDRAEAAIGKDLASGWQYAIDGVTITCTPTVLVTADPELREHRRSVELRRLALRAEVELGTARADTVHRLAERWLEVLGQLEAHEMLRPEVRQLLLPYAAALTDETFGAVVHSLATHRLQLTNDLASVLQQAAANHERVGLYEFANAYDKALRSYCRQMGLDPFAWLQSDEDGAE